jgi:uncharacterized protein
MSDHWTENESSLSESAKNVTRALKTLMEEVEATMFYHQRVDVTTDVLLREIMAHNRDEEIEHACMSLEWLRRNMDGWDKELRTYLFTEGSLLDVEDQAENSEIGTADDGSLSIGNLK